MNRALLKNCSIVGYAVCTLDLPWTVHGLMLQWVIALQRCFDSFMWGGYMQNEPDVVVKVYTELMDLFRANKLPSIAYEHVFNGLDEAPAALEALGSRKSWGKVVVRPRRTSPSTASSKL